MAGKPARHHRIRELIRTSRVESQDRLQTLLRQDGLDVTQATLSRDLRELGVLKGRGGYVLPGEAEREPVPNGDGLRRALSVFAASVRHGGTLVVLKTGP